MSDDRTQIPVRVMPELATWAKENAKRLGFNNRNHMIEECLLAAQEGRLVLKDRRNPNPFPASSSAKPPTPSPSETLQVRTELFARGAVGTDGCWRYFKDGKAQPLSIRTSQGETPAHVAAYLSWVGEIPENFKLAHVCRTALCFNPYHLKLAMPSALRSYPENSRTFVRNELERIHHVYGLPTGPSEIAHAHLMHCWHLEGTLDQNFPHLRSVRIGRDLPEYPPKTP